MEVKVSFNKEKLLNWFDENCEIDCENCPLVGYMCDTLLRKCYEEYIKKDEEGDK